MNKSKNINVDLYDLDEPEINPKYRSVGPLLPNWLLRRTELTLTEKVVYAHLCQRYNEGKGYAWPKQSTIATALGCSERTIRRAVEGLVAARLIKATQPGLGRSMRYTFQAHKWMDDRAERPVRPDILSYGAPDNLSAPIERELLVKKTNRKEAPQFVPPTIDECQTFFVQEGSNKSEGELFFYHFMERDWKISGGGKMKDWRLAVKKWIARNRGWEAEKKATKTDVGSVGKPKWQ